MENEQPFYYNGENAQPEKVDVTITGNELEICNSETKSHIASFFFSDTHTNYLGSRFYLYLDKAGTRYLEYSSTHPLIPEIVEKTGSPTTGKLKYLTQQKPFILLAILLALGAGLYILIITIVPVIGMKLIGTQQEIAIGNKLKEVLLQQEPIFGNKTDTTAGNILQEFTDNLHLSNRYPIKITVVRSKIVNAYALPGGNIVVYKGILRKIKTPEELAALLSHESTHVNERHSLRSMLRSAANGIIISILFGDASGISGIIASNAETLNGLRYSRTLETEADKKGMELMIANNVDISGMKQLMQMLEKEDKMPESLSFLSTHPLTKKRVSAANEFIKQHRQTVTARTDLQLIFDKLKLEIN